MMFVTIRGYRKPNVRWLQGSSTKAVSKLWNCRGKYDEHGCGYGTQRFETSGIYNYSIYYDTLPRTNTHWSCVPRSSGSYCRYGSGLSYAELATHHSLEDIAILRSIPNMQICAPADSIELEAQLREAIAGNKPTYIRIGKKGEPNLLSKHKSLGIGKANLLEKGDKILLIGIGPILSEAIKANNILKEDGKIVGVASMGSVKPLDQEFLQQCIDNGYNCWISLEEHHKIGGLGTALLEWLSEQNINNVRLHRIGIEDHFVHRIGDQNYVRESEGLNARAIVNKVKSL